MMAIVILSLGGVYPFFPNALAGIITGKASVPVARAVFLKN
jgi:hypothetical protein